MCADGVFYISHIPRPTFYTVLEPMNVFWTAKNSSMDGFFYSETVKCIGRDRVTQLRTYALKYELERNCLSTTACRLTCLLAYPSRMGNLYCKDVGGKER